MLLLYNAMLLYIIVKVEFSPTEHINDNNGHYGPLETTDKNQLEVTT